MPASVGSVPNLAGLSDAEIAANRNGSSTDDRAASTVRFAIKVIETRGQVSDADVAAVRVAGYSDAELKDLEGAASPG